MLNVGLNLSNFMAEWLIDGSLVFAADISSISHGSAGRDEGQKTRLRAMDASQSATNRTEGTSATL